MEKLDLTKEYKTYFTAKTTPEIIEIGTAQFLSLTGKGDPSGKSFLEKIQALYTTAYTIKFMFKQSSKDFTVSKLECLWWFDENKFGGLSFSETPKKIARSEWEYRLLIRLPEYVTENDVKKGIETAFKKKKIELIKKIEFYEMTEGKSVQMLHTGPFSTEPETLEKMACLMKENGFEKNGLHHEIYLSDFNKTKPNRLKTILREPVK
ncbi:GyrI-like domain-containing protein [Olivibacter sp. SDN3]|uniref:GyrI-like domain-containing protein n=1 Tax=Olivibacter sp. SDN3 TaxID=2764720 RepID=UPI001651ADB4|nr:GyrI-like domain-containing protein [Olivibacter sp. SDN3]QNL47829.1 GyrI-like domain-containing protein [Olivibacter sp. SDN3]